MVHKPKHKVHSFRGLLGDGGQDEINLERQNVNLAYRIIKLNIMLNQYTGNDRLHGVSIWREQQTSIATDYFQPDFSNVDLLGAAVIVWDTTQPTLSTENIIFDNTLFSRNIYVTHTDEKAASPVNYYIEIEEVPVGAATLMQLKLGVARKLSLSQD